MQGTVLFGVRRAYLAEILPGTVTPSQYGFSDDDPRVVVAEDTRIFLVAGGIGGDFSILHNIAGEGWIVEYNTVLAVQAFLYGVQRFFYHAFFQSDACHGAPALRFDEDLSFFVLFGTYLVAEVIVGAQVPVTVPAMFFHGFHHVLYIGLRSVCFVVFTQAAAQLHVVASAYHEQAGNHQRFCLAAFRLVFRGLEGFIRVPGEAVQVQAVVPVGTADEGQHVGAEVLDDVVEGDAQVLEQRHFRTFFVVEGDGLIQDTEVSRFLDVCHRTEDKPHGVIVEAAADVVVAAFGQRLVLVVASSVGELGRSYVDDSFAGSFRYLMHEAHEVLVGVAETHSTTDAALEERGGTGHVEGNHALILVPDVHHAVQFFFVGLHDVDVQQAVPVGFQFGKGSIYFGGSVEGRNHRLSLYLIYNR